LFHNPRTSTLNTYVIAQVVSPPSRIRFSTELMGWMPLFHRHRMMPARHHCGAFEGERPMTDIHILAIDLAKRSLQVCATDRGGSV
jgi:hypothetical protein